MVATLTAYARTPDLLRSLQRAGWGDLDGREFAGLRSTMHGLAASLDDQSGEGLTTVAQVAQRAGLSPRWTRRCMALLEDLGLIRWRRGGVVAGEPTPSWVRISKRLLLDLVHAARPLREAADAARRAITLARVAGLRRVTRNRRSDHAALSADLPTPTGEVSTSPPLEHPPCSHGEPRGPSRCPLCRRGIA